MEILRKVKQLFCKHSYEKHYIPNGFMVVDGWMQQAFDYRCTKCGKRLIKVTKTKEGAE